MAANRPLSNHAKTLLELYEKTGAGFVTIDEVSNWSVDYGYSRSTVRNAYYQQIGFKEAIRKIQRKHRREEGKNQRFPTRSEPKHPNKDSLVGWQATFIDTWRKTGSRIKAIEDAGVRWAKVKKAMRLDAYFKKQCEEVMDLFLVGVEDSMIQTARSGKTTAQKNVLEVFSPQWSPKVKHTHEVSGNIAFTPDTQDMARDTWLNITEGEVLAIEEGSKLPASE